MKNTNENMQENEFKNLGLKKETLKAIDEIGFITPSLIQRESIPMLAQGVDLVAQAQTGSGKTAAFGIHIIEKTDIGSKNVQSLVLVPTRELAVQVATEIKKLAKYFHGFSVVTIYGGASINVQSELLRKGAHVVIGTPGRVIDMIKRGELKLNCVSTLVLDEADRMLDMGFMDDVKFIIRHTPKDRQTLLFSATMPDEIKIIAEEYMNHPKNLNVSSDAVPIDKIKQTYIITDQRKKLDTLVRILQRERPHLCIIFTKTKFWTERLGSILMRRGIENIVLHGDLSQSKRDRAMGLFKSKNIKILVATDIAARGIDVSGVTHVINYDLPMDPNNYAHRIGRTARAGKQGRAITLITPEQLSEFKMMQRNIGIFVNEEKEDGTLVSQEIFENDYDDYSLEEHLTGFDLHRIKKEEAQKSEKRGVLPKEHFKYHNPWHNSRSWKHRRKQQRTNQKEVKK